MTSSISDKLSNSLTWAEMTPLGASMACLDTSAATDENEDSEFRRTMKAILCPLRLAALEAADVAPVAYNNYSFFSKITTIRGRNFPMLVAPLVSLFFWGLCWQLLFWYGPKDESAYIDVTDVQEYFISIESLIDPLLTPLSFLLVFRLGRAAVRFWDSRQAAGKMVEVCRTLVASVVSEFMSPIRLSNIRCTTREEQPRRDPMDNEHDTARVHEKQNDNDTENGEDGAAIKLLCEFSRWLAVFPIAVKFFLRPEHRKGWNSRAIYAKRRFEIGPLLSDDDALKVIMEYDDEDGTPSSTGVRARDPPLVVLNRLHELAFDLAHFQYNDCVGELVPTPTRRAIFHQGVSSQINVLFAAYGAMERIKGTPLPYAYSAHLRSFLLIYLFLINMIDVAKFEWVSLPFLFLYNWSLLGIEAAAVECESPFNYNANHLTLGKASVLIARNVSQALKEMVH